MIDNEFEEQEPAGATRYIIPPRKPELVYSPAEERAIIQLKAQRDKHFEQTGEPLCPFVGSVQSVDKNGDTSFLILFFSPSNPDGKGIRYKLLRGQRVDQDEFLDYISVTKELIDKSAQTTITNNFL